MTVNGQPVDLSQPRLLTATLTRFRGAAGVQEFSGRLTGASPVRHTGFLPAWPATQQVSAGTRLAQMTGVSQALMGGGAVGHATPAQAFHLRDNGQDKEVQLQMRGGEWIKAVKVRFTQRPRGVEAAVAYARYVRGERLGQDFDAIPASAQLIAIKEDQPGYGCAAMTLEGLMQPALIAYELDADAVLTVTGDNDYTGPTGIVSGTVRAGHVNAFGRGRIVVRGSGTLDKNGLALPNEIAVIGGGAVLE